MKHASQRNSIALAVPVLLALTTLVVSRPTCAQGTTYNQFGQGCGKGYNSVYEYLPPNQFDLDGVVLRGTRSGLGWRWTVAPGSLESIGSVAAATQLALGNDDSVSMPGLTVTSNGIVGGHGVTTDWDPFAPDMLASIPEVFCLWMDLDPSQPGSGKIYFENDVNRYQVTYDGVFSWSSTDPNTFQFFIDRDAGVLELRIGAISEHSEIDYVVGYSPGRFPSQDPGPTDLSAVTQPISSPDYDEQALALFPVNSGSSAMFPSLSSPSTFRGVTGAMPPDAFVHVGIVGLSTTNVPLAVLGLDLDCTLYVTPDVFTVHVFGATVPEFLQWDAAALPAAPHLAGMSLYLQSLVFDVAGTFDGQDLASDGLEYVLGM